jgi:hypothetical protein
MPGLPDGYFKTKNPNLANFLGSFNGRSWYILWPCGLPILRPLRTFVVIWYIFCRFGTLYQEKSGNPATYHLLAKKKKIWNLLRQNYHAGKTYVVLFLYTHLEVKHFLIKKCLRPCSLTVFTYVGTYMTKFNCQCFEMITDKKLYTFVRRCSINTVVSVSIGGFIIY